MAASTTSTTTTITWVVVVVVFWCCLHFLSCHAAVPAVYVFGDSLADVGNNNHIAFSLLKADFPHNGVDFPGGKATGRFSNGRNSADFLAEKLGIPSSPPYLAISSSSNTTGAFLGGVSFASGGAGVLDSTNKDQCLTLDKQIDYYSTVYASLVQQLGSSQTQYHLSKSIFAFIIGSNDILGYSKSSSAKKLRTPASQFVDSLTYSLKSQLMRIYNLGARKFVFVGTGPIGCCPSQRAQNSTGGCNIESNYLSLQYNKGVSSLLQEMKSESSDMNYTFFDTYSALLEFIQSPAAYGFSDVKDACCGLGNLNAKVGCLPVSTLCQNRKDHIFWDFYHPTETTAELLTSISFDGSPPYVYPINVQQLSAL